MTSLLVASLSGKKKDNGCNKYGGLRCYTPKKYDPKCAYPWMMNATRPGTSSNKKQAMEESIDRPDVLLRSVNPSDKASNCTDGCNAHRTLDCSDKVEGNDIVSGGLKVTANGKAIIDNQSFTQSFGTTSQLGEIGANAHLAVVSGSNLEGNAKKQKAHKREKLPMAGELGPNIYPLSNKSLLSTGVFDGAPVKYAGSSCDIILHGIIKGAKILCSCKECNNSKFISPSKFERHAGGKTKKPHSYIYLENGKTINQVRRELRATPRDLFFHRLPKIAGSAFGWLSFNAGKGYPNLDRSPAAPPPAKMLQYA